jgi:hypothetical protein
MKSHFISIMCAATILGITVYNLPYESELKHLGADTIQYLEYSDLILSDRLLTRTNIKDLPKGSVVRGPGFPAALSMGRLLFPNDLRVALLCVHAFFGLVAGSFVCIVFRRYLPAWASALVIAFLFGHMRPWFNGICTEWTMFTLVLSFLGSALLFFETPTPKTLAVWTAITALLPSVRPNFTLAWMIPLVSMLSSRKISRAESIKAFTVGLFPLFILLLLNYYRFNVISLTPYGGRNFFIAGMMSGKPSVYSSDGQTLARFIELVNQQKHPFSSAELSLTEGDGGFERHLERYLGDFSLAENIAGELGLDHIQLNHYSATYASRAIRQNILAYLALQLRWYLWLVNKMIYFIPTVLLAGMWLRRRQNSPLVLASLGLLSLQLIQMASVIATQPPLERYLITTHYVLVYATLLATWRFYSTNLARKSS